MICPKCGSNQTHCVDTRQRPSYRYRRYHCYGCENHFKTYEVIDSGGVPDCNRCEAREMAERKCDTCALKIAVKGLVDAVIKEG